MTNLKPFDIEAAKRGEPVVTRHGRKAEYLGRHTENINCCYAFRSDGYVFLVDELGKYYHDGGVSVCDLFMAAPAIPEDSLSLEDAVFQLSCALNDGDLPHAELKSFVQAFADAIVQRSVEKMKDNK